MYKAFIYDIKNIIKPIKVDELPIKAEDRNEAMDKAHSKAEELYPTIKRMIEIAKVS